MLVSYRWLQDYVDCPLPPAEITHRLMMAGLNHESTTPHGDDFCLDLEVTSNRPDCLGHLGVAREIAVLFERELKLPSPQPKAPAGAAEIATLAAVRVEAPQLCPRYQARVIRGAKVKPSPAWLVQKLAAIGQPAVNNIVDITNFVLMECGQPLHAFDLARLAGRKIIVRRAAAGETFLAIDHKTYTLDSEMCVIADAQRAVAIAGVMGGAETEITRGTTEILIESAQFAPLAVRNASRKLKLSSDSSYRFERGTDPEGVDWASRRCCELILELAGGELAAGVLDIGPQPQPRTPVVLRLSQLKRILGIEIPPAEVRRILAALGCRIESESPTQLSATPPSWRRDLTREIDLVEEAARIHGYDKIPEDVQVPMVPSHRSNFDRVLAKVRLAAAGAGFDEAYTTSVVTEKASSAFSPWTSEEPITCNQPMLKGADRLRRSLLPSLLEARRINESLANPVSELFEVAKIYLPRPGQLPHEQHTLGLVSGFGFSRLKGFIETVVRLLNPALALTAVEMRHELFLPDQAAELQLAGKRLGFLGALSPAGQKKLGLRGEACACEVSVDLLTEVARLTPQFTPLQSFPAIARDLNLIVAEAVRWADLSAVVQGAGGPHLAEVAYRDTYRDPAKDGPGKKRLLLSLTLRSPERTLTSEEADGITSAVVTACEKSLSAVLLR